MLNALSIYIEFEELRSLNIGTFKQISNSSNAIFYMFQTIDLYRLDVTTTFQSSSEFIGFSFSFDESIYIYITWVSYLQS